MIKKIIQRFLKSVFISISSASLLINLSVSCSVKEQENVNIDTSKITYEYILEQDKINLENWPKIDSNEYLSLSNNAYTQINETGDSAILKKEQNGAIFLEYIDPYTQIKFKEYPLRIKNNQATFLLGKKGLVLLATEFKRKVPFSHEVFDLDSININLNGYQENANGAYSDKNKAIYLYLNLTNQNKLLPEQVLALLLPTLFHEYTHHIATSYFSNRDYVNKNNNLITSSGYTFNKNFITQFLDLLNIDSISELNQNSLKDIINFANNSNNDSLIKNYQFSKILTNNTTIKQIKYLYSYEELIAREYTKYAFESYFNKKDQLKYKNSTSSFLGLYINNKWIYHSHLYDWSRTIYFENQNDILSNWKTLKHIYNNDLFDKSLNDHFMNFYNLFLEYIGYNSNISQIYYENNWQYIYDNQKINNKQIWIDDSKFKNIRFTGYIDNNYTGFVFLDKKTGEIQNFANFNFMETFNFFGKSDYDNGSQINDKINRDVQLRTRLYPTSVYKSYYTDFVNFNDIKDDLIIYFYQDKNNDNTPEYNEIMTNTPVSLPDFSIINLKGNLSYYDIDKLIVYKNNQNETILHLLKKEE